MNSALYMGTVIHQRTRPKAHRLRYRVFCLLADLDELPELGQRLKLFGHNARGLFSFHDRDHGDGEGAGLRAWVDAKLAESGMSIDGGRVTVLSYPRMFGYVFNPLSVFFCYRADGTLEAILYEVANTYSERHTYVIPAPAPDHGVVKQSADKVFYVSPFLPVSGRYRFRIAAPGEEVGVTITLDDEEGPMLTAAFHGKRRALTDGSLLRAFFAYPLMTLKVMAGIHWEALKLWRKGFKFRKHAPADKAIASSIVTPVRVPRP